MSFISAVVRGFRGKLSCLYEDILSAVATGSLCLLLYIIVYEKNK